MRHVENLWAAPGSSAEIPHQTAIMTDLFSVYASQAALPNSRPKPDCLNFFLNYVHSIGLRLAAPLSAQPDPCERARPLVLEGLLLNPELDRKALHQHFLQPREMAIGIDDFP